MDIKTLLSSIDGLIDSNTESFKNIHTQLYYNDEDFVLSNVNDKCNNGNLFVAVYDANNGEKIKQTLVHDEKIYLNLEKIYNSVNISIIYQGEDINSTLKIKDANIVAHTQITPSAYERIKKELSF